MVFQSRLMIRLALMYFLIGSTLGGLILTNKAYHFDSSLWELLPVHIEFMIFGWIIQFTLGVAYWILPRFFGEDGRGKTWLATIMVLLFNLGIWLVASSQYGLLPEKGALIGRISEAAAVAIFISLHWKRVLTYNR
ncbi:MAG: cbb3-type cytochrome c oxidase subunit I [Balneolaceae bacterium]